MRVDSPGLDVGDGPLDHLADLVNALVGLLRRLAQFAVGRLFTRGDHSPSDIALVGDPPGGVQSVHQSGGVQGRHVVHGPRIRIGGPHQAPARQDQEGYSAGSWRRSPWTTCVRLDHLCSVGPPYFVNQVVQRHLSDPSARKWSKRTGRVTTCETLSHRARQPAGVRRRNRSCRRPDRPDGWPDDPVAPDSPYTLHARRRLERVITVGPAPQRPQRPLASHPENTLRTTPE